VFRPPDRQCSHLGPLTLFCKADTLLIASCLFWSENWLLVYFLPHPSPIVCFTSMGFLVTQILSQHKPSCILSQHEVHCQCTVERLVDAPPFSLLFDTSLFQTLLIHSCTICRAVTILGSLLTSNRRICLLICFQAPVTQSRCLRTSSSADPHLIAFGTPLFHVDFRYS